MFAFTLLVISLLCLAFEPTRLLGLAGTAAFLYLYPLLFVVLLILGGIAFYLLKEK